MSLPRTLGDLRPSTFSEQRLSIRRVKDELRENLVRRLQEGGSIFPGIVGYEDTVVPQIINAVLSRQLLYTALTRARSRIELWATDEVLAATIASPIQRSAALRLRLARYSYRGLA